MSIHREIKRLSAKAIEEQKAGPRRLPRQTINNQPRTKPAQEVVINRLIRKQESLVNTTVVRKINTPGNNLNF